jgi:hypothetical protein
MKCYNSKTKELLAVGKHTKYLPMGRVYDWLFAIPAFFPYLTQLFETFGPRAKQANLPEDYKLEDFLKFDDAAAQAGGEGGSKSRKFTVLPYHMNPMGMFHGGAQSSVSQILSDRYIQDELKGSYSLSSMSTTYISAGKGAMDITVTDDNVSSNKNQIQRRLLVTNKKGQPISESLLVYGKD